MLSPFSAFGSILLDAIANEDLLPDDATENSMGSFLSTGISSLGGKSLRSKASLGCRSHVSKVLVADRLVTLCNELNAPAEFAELLGKHLLRIDVRSHGGGSQRGCDEVGSEKRTLAYFMARTFQHCTRNADLVVIVLDDVHMADEASWQVLQELFETGSNLVVLCTTRPLTKYNLAIDEQFWDLLNSNRIAKGRYTHIELHRLDGTEMKSMIAKTLGVTQEEVSDQLSRSILAQTSGKPVFVQFLLEEMKKEASLPMESKMVCILHPVDADKRLSWSCFWYVLTVRCIIFWQSGTQLSLSQLMLQRIDGFAGQGRNILNVAAILGLSFEFSDLVEVVRHLNVESGSAEQQLLVSDTPNIVKAILDFAVREGILHEQGADDDQGAFSFADSSLVAQLHRRFTEKLTSMDGTCCYAFTHDVWRSTILKLMLDSSKQNIHHTIAITLDAASSDSECNYVSQLRIFGHWKWSGDFVGAATVALAVGETFEGLGLSAQSIRLSNEAIDMWKDGDGSLETLVGGFSRIALDSATYREVEAFIKLHIALGKALATQSRLQESVEAYQTGLVVSGTTKRSFW